MVQVPCVPLENAHSRAKGRLANDGLYSNTHYVAAKRPVLLPPPEEGGRLQLSAFSNVALISAAEDCGKFPLRRGFTFRQSAEFRL